MADLARSNLIGGRYELEEQLGRGGMGEVWRARHVALNNHFAIKFLHRASAQRDLTRKRFETEAQVTAQLKTRHAVQVFDFGITDEGQPYLVMELLDGETVGHRLDRVKQLPVPTTARFLAQASRALERAHALGIVHRDFKPDNIVIARDEDGREYIKVLDFGIAKILGDLEAEPGEEDPPPVGPHQSFTRTGSILGTPYYMAPEQIRNARDIDARVDIWAFGVVAFECLVGVPPFDGKDVYELFERIQAGIHARANDLNPAVPKEFDTWFDIACAVDTTHRFANAAVAATHLAVALGENGDAETTGPGGWQHGDRASERSGARLKEHAALALAQTIEQTLAGKVLSRKRRTVGESASSLPLVRIAKDPAMETPAPARTATPEPAARVSPVVPASRPSTRGARWIMIACAGLAGGATAFWLRPFLPHRTPTSVASPSVWTPEPPVAAALVHPTSISAPSAPADPLPAPATTGPPSAPPVHPSASPLRASPAPKMPAALAPQTAPAPPAASASVTASPQPSQAPPSRPSSSPFQLPPLAF